PALAAADVPTASVALPAGSRTQTASAPSAGGVYWDSGSLNRALIHASTSASLHPTVIGDFTVLALAYEAALAALGWAVLHLQAGRTTEVKEVAGGMGWIFEAKGIAGEGLAAPSFFCAAAMQEPAPIEMAKQVTAEIEKARRSASLSPALRPLS